MQVCLIDDAGRELRRDLASAGAGVWAATIPDVGAGQRYGYRAWGRWDPRIGLRTNPHKLLLDPYARQVTGDVGDPAYLAGHDGDPFGAPSRSDSLGHGPVSLVTGATAARTEPLRTPWSATTILELHVGSYTARHPDLSPALRGTYLGLAADPVLDHLRRIGVTAVELLPVQAFLTEPPVRARGRRNHWGYAPAAWFAPHPGYATRPGAERAEFARMVERLHDADIEVILDVVYNHTCEGTVAGPTISWRGLDAPGYYRLAPGGTDIDLTGCGNTVRTDADRTRQMIRDSLRHWVTEFGIDGFRFDLASVLGRVGAGPFDPAAPALTAITDDPVLRSCKLIAEPWDATGDGYALGRFGPPWAEWNDRFRDAARGFFIGVADGGELARRIGGSPDLFGISGSPARSVDFVTAHDGFTAADLVSYAHKHNEANGERNTDGSSADRSVNHGVEGPTTDPTIRAARDRHVRALLATLLLSAGTPMLLGGDELGNSQGGNNNAYCVPEGTPRSDAWPVSWIDPKLVGYLARLAALRRALPADPGVPPVFDTTGLPLELDSAGGSMQVRIAPGWLLLFQAAGTADFVAAGPDSESLQPVLDSTRPDGIPDGRTGLRLTGPAVLVLCAVNASAVPGSNRSTNGTQS
ncbi:glycogen debranching protein GlgX [Skermania piniformis]